jgi:hypothetical protein
MPGLLNMDAFDQWFAGLPESENVEDRRYEGVAESAMPAGSLPSTYQMDWSHLPVKEQGPPPETSKKTKKSNKQDKR